MKLIKCHFNDCSYFSSLISSNSTIRLLALDGTMRDSQNLLPFWSTKDSLCLQFSNGIHLVSILHTLLLLTCL